MKYRYLVHTGFGDEEFEIQADGYDVVGRPNGSEVAVAFWVGILIDGSMPARTTLLHQSLAPGYWIQTFTTLRRDRIERTNPHGS